MCNKTNDFRTEIRQGRPRLRYKARFKVQYLCLSTEVVLRVSAHDRRAGYEGLEKRLERV